MTDWGYPAFSTIDVGATGVAETVEWGDVPRRSLPDLTDPATLGCLLALVRKAWREPDAYIAPADGWFVNVRFGVHFEAPTEAAALVAALEAAP